MADQEDPPPTLENVAQGYADASWEAQRGRDWTGKRVRRVDEVYEVLQDDVDGGKVQVRDVHLARTRTLSRREFLSRGLDEVDRPGE